MAKETGGASKNIHGDKLYQRRARMALPLLVRQAHAGNKIFYADLAAELGMTNPRTLNYVLGSIGTTLKESVKRFGEPIPPIQCLVVNQATGLPGEGVGWFIDSVEEFKQLSRRKQRAIVDRELADVIAYPRWNEVLDFLGLEPTTTEFTTLMRKAADYQAKGEGEAHLRLKRFVAAHPEVVGLPGAAGPGEQEKRLPSGDSLDVCFHHRALQMAVEVKANSSPEHDIVRGLFQCVKYRAVLRAMIAVANGEDNADAVLVYEGRFPENLLPLRNLLDVRVFDQVKPT